MPTPARRVNLTCSFRLLHSQRQTLFPIRTTEAWNEHCILRCRPCCLQRMQQQHLSTHCSLLILARVLQHNVSLNVHNTLIIYMFRAFAPDDWFARRDARANRPADRVSTWPSLSPIILTRVASLTDASLIAGDAGIDLTISSDATSFGTVSPCPVELNQCFRMPEVVANISLHSG